MQFLLLASAIAAAGAATPFKLVDFTRDTHSEVVLAHEDRSAVPGSPAIPTAGLPSIPPSLPSRGSAFSTLLRARDVVDVANTPARAVAKLFRLTPANKRSATACTATFIGPRHLLTAGHCIVDRSKGVPHPGLEIVSRYDLGKSADGAPFMATRAWVPADQWILTNPLDALVTPDKCSDYAVVEIDRMAPPAIGWLGMRHSPAPGLLHRFSYPHRSAADMVSPPPPGASAEDVAFVDKERADTLRREAEFAPSNLYYEYGRPDAVEPSHFVDRNGYTLPGRSGAALIDSTGAIVGLLSRAYDGATYTCRLTPAEIGAIMAIVEGRSAAPPRKSTSRN